MTVGPSPSRRPHPNRDPCRRHGPGRPRGPNVRLGYRCLRQVVRPDA